MVQKSVILLINFLKKYLRRTTPFFLTPEFQESLKILENTSQNVFLTGKAGTGKSTLIQYFRSHSKKSIVVVAPTGIAAYNIGGQTIHSFFKFPPGIIDKKAIHDRIDTRLYMDIDTVVIDEISMVRADVLDGIDLFLRRYGRSRSLPFGGAQIILVGDLYQLPPVVTKEEVKIFRKLYETPYFFNSNVFKLANFKIVELTTIFRQKQDHFIEILNQIRVGEIDNDALVPINNRVSQKNSKDHIILTTTNGVADGINQAKLDSINKPLFTFNAIIEGNFPDKDRHLPAPKKLDLKKGARVMFVKNDRGGRWINGTLGWISELNSERIRVKLSDESGEKEVTVPLEEWENVKYEYDDESEEIKTIVVGKLKQFPLRMAWAVTIHKSQGMTFSKVKIDFTKSPFAHGQTYVALSRCRTLEGLLLTKRIWLNDIIIDPEITEFHKVMANK